MIWKYINTGGNKGSFNMEFDMNLVKDISPGNVFFRLYRWNPFCISLGANQNLTEINSEKAEVDGIDIVKRPTGGRAILHSEELTYSVVMPLNLISSPRKIYQQINLALIEGLKIYNENLSLLEVEGIQPDLLSFYKENLSAACFGVPAKNEIKYSGKKLVGSAQRKIGSSLLQHGSIMCGNYHVNLADYLDLPADEITGIKENLRNKTTELETILNFQTDYEKLSESLVEGFQKFFEVKMLREELILND
jgi:lipoyl(octanoyl) transferase